MAIEYLKICAILRQLGKTSANCTQPIGADAVFVRWFSITNVLIFMCDKVLDSRRLTRLVYVVEADVCRRNRWVISLTEKLLLINKAGCLSGSYMNFLRFWGRTFRYQESEMCASWDTKYVNSILNRESERVLSVI